MFQEMSHVVEIQGEALDTIEFSVVNVKNFTKNAGKSIINAELEQQKRLSGCLLLSCISLIFAIALPIHLTDRMPGLIAKIKEFVGIDQYDI